MIPTPNQPVQPIDSPTGLDLHPKRAGIVRLSKRAAWIVGVVIIVVIVGCAYGLIRRSVAKMQIASPGEAKRTTLATQAGQKMASYEDSRPAAPIGQLMSPSSAAVGQLPSVAGCDIDPQTGQVARFSKLSGAPCPGSASALPQKRFVVRQGPPHLMA
jgi:hypothetical protein